MDKQALWIQQTRARLQGLSTLSTRRYHQAWCAVGRVLRDNAAVLPAEEEEEATVTTPGAPPWAPPSCQVFQQDAPHVRHDILFIALALFFWLPNFRIMKV